MPLNTIVRASSYGALIGTFFYFFYGLLIPFHASGPGDGLTILGDSVTNAISFLAPGLVLLLAAALLNAIGFAISPPPRTGLRKFELFLFQIPLLLLAIIAIVLFPLLA